MTFKEYVDNNNISDLSSLENLTDLKTLFINNNNNISDLKGLQYLTDLKTLYLSNNNITDLSSL